MEGLAEKKGKGQSKFGRKNWKLRYFAIDDQYFTYWTRPRGKRRGFCKSAQISSPSIEPPSGVPENSPFYYLSVSMAGRMLLLRFRDLDERDKWFEVMDTIAQGKSVVESPCIAKTITKKDPLEIFDRKENRKSILSHQDSVLVLVLLPIVNIHNQ